MNYRNQFRASNIVMMSLALLSVSRVSAAADPVARPSPEIVIAAATSRLQALQNISVSVEETIGPPPVGGLPPRETITTSNGYRLMSIFDETWNIDFSLLNSSARWDSRLTEKTMAVYKERGSMPIKRKRAALVLGRTEQLDERGESEYLGSISASNRSIYSLFQTAIGFTSGTGSVARWIDSDRLAAMKVQIVEDDNAELTETDSDGGTHQWLLRADKGYAIGSYHYTCPKGKPACAPYELVVDEFKLIEGIPIPMHAVYKTFRQDGIELLRWTMKVKSVKLNDPENVADKFKLKWPKGVDVTDERTGSVVRTQVEDTILDDKTYGELLEQAEAARVNRMQELEKRRTQPSTRP